VEVNTEITANRQGDVCFLGVGDHGMSETVLRIMDQAEAILSLFPSGGHPGRVDGTRELVFADLPYIVIYATQRFTVYIVCVFHTPQDFQRVMR
jgi:plasmid stabilization system protein ParE